VARTFGSRRRSLNLRKPPEADTSSDPIGRDRLGEAVALEQIIQVVGENTTSIHHDMPLADSFLCVEFKKIVSVWYAASRKLCDELVGRGEHDDIGKIFDAGLSPAGKRTSPFRRRKAKSKW